MSIKFENTEVIGWEAAIRGMRNSLNSLDKSDSGYCLKTLACHSCKWNRKTEVNCNKNIKEHKFVIGKDDFNLMKRLRNAGIDHCKFMQMITVCVDITAPLYWWLDYDDIIMLYCQGKHVKHWIGMATNNYSMIYKNYTKEFTLDDFSYEHSVHKYTLKQIIKDLNFWRKGFLIDDDSERVKYISNRFDVNYVDPNVTKKECWLQMISFLPLSYNQKRTVKLNYEILAKIYMSRKNHEFDEWKEHRESTCSVKDDTRECRKSKEWLLCEDCFVGKGFCDWIKTLPYSELITIGDEI